MDELAVIREDIATTKADIATTKADIATLRINGDLGSIDRKESLLSGYLSVLTEQQKKENILLARAGNSILHGVHHLGSDRPFR
jgi:hypothetical protein